MLEIILWLSCLPVPVAMFIAYRRNRDPLHPLMYLGPMMLYIYAFVPLVLYYRGLVAARFPDEPAVVFAQSFILLGTICFCAGVLHFRVRRGLVSASRAGPNLSEAARHRLLLGSYGLGTVGVAAFLYMLVDAGGIAQAYKFSKGGVGADSGYVTTAPYLTIVAIMMHLLARQGRRMGIRDVFILGVYISPHLLHGLLGASRGTIFLALGTLVFGWYLTTARRPALWRLVTAVVIIGLVMILLKSHRRGIYVGSDLELDPQTFMESLLPATDTEADNASYTWGLILVARHHGIHPWGRRYLVHLLIRPVPKQLWPTKYSDMARLLDTTGTERTFIRQWRSTTGWEPNRGSATGFIADSFLEFSWGGLIVCYLVGLLYAYLWRQAVTRAGIWSALYFIACVVSVYLPTQGLATAWAYRFIYLAAPTLLLWRYVIAPAVHQGGRRGVRSSASPTMRIPTLPCAAGGSEGDAS